MTRSFTYRHEISLEDTNLVGNVYFANHVRWQGRCRELFLREHAPSVLDALERGLALVTMSVSCTYLAELRAFDVVEVRMSAGDRSQNRLELCFEYCRIDSNCRQTATGLDLLAAGHDVFATRQDQVVARGQQWIASMRRQGDRLVAVPLPEDLLLAIDQFNSEPRAPVPV